MKIAYMIRRVLAAFFVFLVVLTLNFFIPRLGVSDPAERYYPSQGGLSDAEYEIVKAQTRDYYDLNGTTLEQYTRYVRKLFQGDLGRSFKAGSPKVIDLILERLPWTLVLSVSTMLIGVILGTLYGAFAAWKRGRLPDLILLNASTATTALPSFFLALILTLWLGFNWEVLPAYTDADMVAGFDWSLRAVGQVFYNALLPIISMSIGSIIGYAQSTRNSVIAVADEDFIVTAYAKGLSTKTVLYKHVLRNALLPIVTNLGMSISGLIGGAVVIEQIFNWHGMGTLFLEANNTNDYPLMMGIMLFMSTFAILANLITELCYVLLDPRVSVERR